MYEVGDKVVVVNMGQCYPCYFDNEENVNRLYKSGYFPKKNKVYKIIDKFKHRNIDLNLYILKNNNNIVVMNEDGIKLK